MKHTRPLPPALFLMPAAILFNLCFPLAAMGHTNTGAVRTPVEDRPVRDYFQQKVDYRIEAELDAVRHLLHARVEISYENRSPDTLRFLYIHLWPNAYRDNHTAFAQQKAASGSWAFFNAPDSLRGGIDSLDFRTAGAPMRWTLLTDTPDVARVELLKPLMPGERVIVATPFRVRIPGNFSRLGRDRGQYQLCQWYPKPAVYDRDGWHPMPYLDQGEFYSEFGDFDVQITVPAHFRVAGAGELKTESEQAWLDSLSAACWALDSFPKIKNTAGQATAGAKKTLNYRLENAHDFAWFCGPDYYVRQSEVRLPHSGRTVKTAVFFTRSSQLWKDAAQYVDSSVYYYSLWVGDYPWSNCTAVDGALSAGGGMEYPTITVIAGVGSARTLELIIAHEVGHNWFYGILASNERDHPFMDEGFNSYYESRYMRQRFANDGNSLGLGSGILAKRLGLADVDADQLSWLLSCRRGREAALWSSSSTDFDSETYGTLVYKKTALELGYLDAYLGRERFDRMMKGYFEMWKFRHPSPRDMKESLQSALKSAGGGRATEWWFANRLQTDRAVDYRMGRISRLNQKGGVAGGAAYRVRVRGMGIGTPFLLAALDEQGQMIRQEWYEPFEGRRTLNIQLNVPAKKFVLDPERRMPLAYRERSGARVGHWFPSLPGLRLMPGLDDAKNRLWLLPVVGANRADGALLGLALMSPPVFPRNFEYALMPVAGMNSGAVGGQASVRQNFRLPSSPFAEVQLRGDWSRYTNYQFGMGLTPSMRWEMAVRARLREERLSVRRTRLLVAGVVGSPWRTLYPIHTMDLLPNAHSPRLLLGHLGYRAEHPGLVHSYGWQADAEWGTLKDLAGHSGAANARVSASVTHKWYYKTRGNRAFVAHRWFAGLAHVADAENPVGFLGHGSGVTGWLDWGCREPYYGRGDGPEGGGPLPMNLRQVSGRERDAGLRSVMNPMFVSALQNSRPATRLLAGNWVLTLPRIPLELYAGMAYTSPIDSVIIVYNDAWRPEYINYPGYLGEVGVSLSVFNGFLRINRQLAATDALRPGFMNNTGRKPGWYEYFSWSIDLKRLNPHDLVRNFRM